MGIGSNVKTHIKGDKTIVKFQIVGEFEGNAEEGKVSAISPIGKALLGKKQGDEVTVNAPIGDFVYVIDKIQ